MNLEKELAENVLSSIALEQEVYLVDMKYQEYFQHIHKPGYVFDVKLFNDVDRRHTKYLLRKLS